MKTITKTFLKKHNACESGVRVAEQEKMIGLSPDDFIKKLMKLDHFDWANWLIVRLMNKKQKVMYAIFAAELVLHIFEKKYRQRIYRKAKNDIIVYLNLHSSY